MDGYVYPGSGYNPYALDAVAGSLWGLMLTILIIPFVLAVVCYVFHACSLHAIAKRRGIRHGWLSWIPIGNLWILGSVSDQYRYVVKGQITNRRKLLLWLTVAMLLGGVTVATLIVAALFAASIGFLLLVVLLLLAEMALTVAVAVFLYIALYDLFQSCNPGNAVLFLVLSILVPVTLPFFLFACRNKDEGMPPRKQRPVAERVVREPEILTAPKTETTEQQSADEEVAEGFAKPEEFEEE